MCQLSSGFGCCSKDLTYTASQTCKSCKKKGDERKLLICDVCDTGYHCGCLRPPLKKVFRVVVYSMYLVHTIYNHCTMYNVLYDLNIILYTLYSKCIMYVCIMNIYVKTS